MREPLASGESIQAAPELDWLWLASSLNFIEPPVSMG
jgi:hypothetical protein